MKDIETRETTGSAFPRLRSFSLCFLVLFASTARAAGKIEYNRDIRPILAENCFRCHGPDSAARKAGLRLDQRAAAIKMSSIVPGKPDESDLIKRINTSEPNELMPPKKSLKSLTQGQKDLLKAWIASGAEYQPHWSLIAPTRPAVPAVKNAGWVRNPIDNFVLAELEKRGLTPADEADRRTLARRVSLDLTGLPPAPADVEAFVNDKSPDAYEKLVDRFLASPHWGEHRGRYWLDVARYADTHGIHFDNFREIWAYREWVINAFNENKRFDQFTIEQLAGDLLPNRTLDQVIASGFNRCNITTNEGGVIPEEYLVLYARDRTETMAQVWMGTTAGCAVCHDHKFDPLTMRDFYSMAAFFNNTTQGAMDGNIKDTPPVVVVTRMEDRQRFGTLVADLGYIKQQREERKQAARSAFDNWLKDMKADQIAALVPHDGLRFHAPLSEGKGKSVTVSEDGKPRTVQLDRDPVWLPGHVAASAYRNSPGSALDLGKAGDFEKDQPFTCAAWVRPTKNGENGAILARMDDSPAAPAPSFRGWDLWLEAGRVGTHIIHRWPDDALKVVARTPLKTGQWHHIVLSYDGSAKVSGIKLYVNGVLQPFDVQADKLQNTIRTTMPLKIGQRHTQSRLEEVVVHDVRLYGKALTGKDAADLAKATRAAFLAGKVAKDRTPAEQNELFDWYLIAMDKPSHELAERQAKLEQEEAQLKQRATIAHVMQERNEPAMAFILYRGDYDKRRDKVTPNTPAALPLLPPDLPKNRLGLAKWLLRPEHPLTARVTVNRFWQELFGTGLVRTSGDFGVAGELPTHPELLDWLAVEFRENGWDIKKFYKLLVTSATYRQAAVQTPEKREKDPINRYLSRGPRYRMDAEMVRDYALAASGLLVRKLGGPSVKPYQPDGVWEAVAMIGSDTRDYRRDSGENLYRRSMYTFWKRSAPPASMEIFNAPTRETCAVRRERTNTPLQALVTLNDPQFIEAARHLAQVSLKEGGDRTLDFMSMRLLARTLRPEERKIAEGTLNELLAYYRSHADDAKKLIEVGESKADPSVNVSTLAAWTMLANQLMNLDEVLNK
jgi:hypothetical protein